jgi:hypothetical protein
LVEKIEHSRRYRLTKPGYRVSCLTVPKPFGMPYAPLTAAVIAVVAADRALADSELTRLDASTVPSLTRSIHSLTRSVSRRRRNAGRITSLLNMAA